MRKSIKIETSKVVDRKGAINLKKNTVVVFYQDGTKEVHTVPALAEHCDAFGKVKFVAGPRWLDASGKAFFQITYNDGVNEGEFYQLWTGAGPDKILGFGDGFVEIQYASGAVESIEHEVFKDAESVTVSAVGKFGVTFKVVHKRGVKPPPRIYTNYNVTGIYKVYVPVAAPAPAPAAPPPAPRDRNYADGRTGDRLRIVALDPSVTSVEALPDKSGWRVKQGSDTVIDVEATGWRKEYGRTTLSGVLHAHPNKYSYVVVDSVTGRDVVRIDAEDVSKSFDRAECHLYGGVVEIGLDGAAAVVSGVVAAKPAAPPSKFSTDVRDMSPWPIIEAVLPHTKRALLYGPPGTGKTHSAVKSGLAREDQPVYAITLTDETPMTELRGHFVMKDNKFEWSHGIAVRAWLEGARLVLNEIDHAGGDVMSFLHVVLDDIELASLTLPTGDTVRPSADFQVVATMNGVPEDLPFALRDRFPVTIAVNEVHPAAVATLSSDLQTAAKNTTMAVDPQRRTSIRVWAEFDKLREGLKGHAVGKQIAANATFGHRAQEVLDGLAIGATK